MRYRKPHTSAQEQVIHLRSRGLLVTDAPAAAQTIQKIGYERLRIYFLSRRHTNKTDKPFKSGATFDDIVAIYDCDLKFRQVCFTAAGQFEILLRNQISEILSQEFGSHPHDCPRAFVSVPARNQSFESVLKIFNKSRDPRAEHFRSAYANPALPPIWVLKEFLTFGQICHLFKALAPSIKTEIAKSFGVWSAEVFESWIMSCLDFRNICAHHDRLFNRRFQKQPRTLKKAGVPIAAPYSLKAIAEYLDYSLEARGQTSNLVANLQAILQNCSQVGPIEVGF